MKRTPLAAATLSLAFALGAAQAQTDTGHDHANPPAPAANTPAANPAHAAGKGAMMDCSAMMHGEGGMHGMMHGQDGAAGKGAMKGGSPSMMMHGAMTCGEGGKMPMSGDVDKDFAAMMIMHHEQAIRMADLQIAHGKNEELKAMARKMRDTQRAEIEKLKKHQ